MAMSEFAIRAEKIGKKYRLGYRPRYKTLREGLTSLVRARRESSQIREERFFWALRDVSFAIREGQAVGIIGRNGAGKSTLLKVLAQITEPTEGTAELRGRVGSLLEVGVGFHQELTGRENIYFNGALLGMKKSEIDRKFDEIVAFAEVDKFLDTQVKHYSSGMLVRLGFSVAAHLETEVLFVDEILAVGDLSFQEKCLGKMKNAASSGRTVLFVSHNLVAVQGLCQHAIWLEQGGIAAEGTPAAVVSQYVHHIRTKVQEVSWFDIAEAPGNEVVRLTHASIRPVTSEDTNAITVRTPLQVTFELWNQSAGSRLDFAINLHNQYGILVFCSGTMEREPLPEGSVRVSGLIPGDLLNAGTHKIELVVIEGGVHRLWSLPDILVFDVADSPELRKGDYDEWPGAVRPNIQWKIEVLEK